MVKRQHLAKTIETEEHPAHWRALKIGSDENDKDTAENEKRHHAAYECHVHMTLQQF